MQSNAWKALRRAVALESLCAGLAALAGAALLAMMVMMTVHVVSRKLGMPVPAAFELSEQLMIVVFAFPLAEIARRGGHISFELVSSKFPQRLRGWLQLAVAFVGLLVFGPLTFVAWRLSIGAFKAGEYRQGIVDIPIWPFRIFLAVGLTLLVLQLAVSCVRALTRRRADTPGEVPVASPAG